MKRKHGICVLILLGMLVFSLAVSVSAGYTQIGVPGAKSYVKRSDHREIIIFVGDSRTMMCTYPGGNQPERANFCFCWVNGGNVSVIKKGGKLTPYVEKMIRKYRGRCVVALNFGVNGNSNPKSNARRIIRYYRWWMNRYPDVQFYVVSVNPTILKSGPYSNRNVISVNKLLRDEFEPEGIYIDTCTMLEESGLVTGSARGMRDNYHYEWIAGKKILKYVRKTVTEKEAKKDVGSNTQSGTDHNTESSTQNETDYTTDSKAENETDIITEKVKDSDAESTGDRNSEGGTESGTEKDKQA